MFKPIIGTFEDTCNFIQHQGITGVGSEELGVALALPSNQLRLPSQVAFSSLPRSR